MLRCAYYDARKRIYDNVIRFATGKPRDSFLFMQEYIDRTEGRPGKTVERRGPSVGGIFVFSDGTPAVPPPRQPVAQGSTPTAARVLDPVEALILGATGLLQSGEAK